MKTPLTFKPVYKDYIWGGDRLSTHFHRSGTPTPCAESWEISAHPDGPSVVAHGPHAGRSLPDLAAAFGASLIFGFAESLQGKLSILKVPIPSQFLLMAPYIFTMIALAGVIGRAVAPAADGKPYTKDH